MRADAMTIRDDQADDDGVTESDWSRIEELLCGSFRASHTAVNA